MGCDYCQPHSPLFKDLVGSLLERESDYLELSQSLCWMETASPSPPPSSGHLPTDLSVVERGRKGRRLKIKAKINANY